MLLFCGKGGRKTGEGGLERGMRESDERERERGAREKMEYGIKTERGMRKAGKEGGVGDEEV